jgi:hypothetical protein
VTAAVVANRATINPNILMTRMTFSPGWAALRISGRGAFAIGKFGLTSLMDGFIYAISHGRYRDGSHTRPLPRACLALRGPRPPADEVDDRVRVVLVPMA